MAPVVSKLTLVRSKTDNVLVIKNKQPAEQQQQQRASKRRTGRALKRKKLKLDVESVGDSDRQSKDQQPDQDLQCKIVKVILENCRTSTSTPVPTQTTLPSDVATTVDSSPSSASRDAVEAAATTTSSTGEVNTQPLFTTTSGSCALSEASRNVSEVSAISVAASAVLVDSRSTGGVVAPSTWFQKTEPSQSSTVSTVADVSATVLASTTSLLNKTPLNGVVSQLPLALGQQVHRLQLVGHPHPAARSLPPGAQRWSVPLVNSAGTWLTLQPVASTSSASIIAPSPASFGLIPAPTAVQTAPPRPAVPVVIDQPRHNRPHVPVAHSSSVINSPIKQFLDHTRSVPPLPPAVDDIPTDLSMKTLRRLEENSRVASTAPCVVPPQTVQTDDAPLDLCTKRLNPNPFKLSPDVQNIATTKTQPIVPILTVPLCFPTGPVERPTVAVAGHVVPAATQSTSVVSPAIKLLQPPMPLVKIDPAATAVRPPTVAAAGGTFPVSPITILHPAFRQLSSFLCPPLLMTPFAAVPTSSSSS